MKLKFFPTNDPKPKKPKKLYLMLYLDDDAVEDATRGDTGGTTCAVVGHVPTQDDIDHNLEASETYLGYVEITQ
jgi:hypothetical protein